MIFTFKISLSFIVLRVLVSFYYIIINEKYVSVSKKLNICWLQNRKFMNPLLPSELYYQVSSLSNSLSIKEVLLFLLQLIRYLMLGKSFSSFSQTLEFTLNPDRLKKMFQIFWSRFVKQAIDNNAFQQILILYSLKELVIA